MFHTNLWKLFMLFFDMTITSMTLFNTPEIHEQQESKLSCNSFSAFSEYCRLLPVKMHIKQMMYTYTHKQFAPLYRPLKYLSYLTLPGVHQKSWKQIILSLFVYLLFIISIRKYKKEEKFFSFTIIEILYSHLFI